MEPTIVQLYGINCPLLALVDYELVVQAKLTFRGSSKVGAHDDVTVDVCAEDSTYIRQKSRSIQNAQKHKNGK